MNAEDWERIQAVFHAALKLPEADRAGFVRRTTGGDERLVAPVLAMLEAHAQASEFIETPAGSPPREAPELGALRGLRLGDFVLEEEIGRGGMGLVYRARQTSLGRIVAVKVLPPALSATSLRSERFQREALAASKLDHPGVAPVISYGEDQGLVYYAMKFVEGPSLFDVLQAARKAQPNPSADAVVPGEPSSVASFIVLLLDVLEYVHRRLVLHRDIKPANILISDRHPVVIDFGLAKDLELESITRTGDSAGTPNYMSPEQVRAARERIDERTDVYSTGAVLYELLTLHPPFEGRGTAEVLHKITTAEPRPPRSLNARIPKPLELICLQALQKDVEDRYSSAAAMRDDLQRFLERRGVLARGPSWRKRTRRALVTRRGLLQASPFLLLAGAGGGYLFHVLRLADAGRARLVLRWDHFGPMRVVVQRTTDVPGLLSPPEHDVEVERGLELKLDPGEVRITLATDEGIRAELSRFLSAGSREEDVTWRTQPPGREADMRPVPGEDVAVHHYAAAGGGDVGEATSHVAVPAFLMDARAVTNGDYQRYLTESGRPQPADWVARRGDQVRQDWDDLPVTGISWVEARGFAEWNGKRLPTLAEWELGMGAALAAWRALPAAEADGRLNLRSSDNGRDRQTSWQDYRAEVRTALDPRGGLGPLGIHHPLGNVQAFTESRSPTASGDALSSDHRYVAGGYWGTPEQLAREDVRRFLAFAPQEMSRPETGFRCVRSASLP